MIEFYGIRDTETRCETTHKPPLKTPEQVESYKKIVNALLQVCKETPENLSTHKTVVIIFEQFKSWENVAAYFEKITNDDSKNQAHKNWAYNWLQTFEFIREVDQRLRETYELYQKEPNQENKNKYNKLSEAFGYLLERVRNRIEFDRTENKLTMSDKECLDALDFFKDNWYNLLACFRSTEATMNDSKISAQVCNVNKDKIDYEDLENLMKGLPSSRAIFVVDIKIKKLVRERTFSDSQPEVQFNIDDKFFAPPSPRTASRFPAPPIITYDEAHLHTTKKKERVPQVITKKAALFDFIVESALNEAQKKLGKEDKSLQKHFSWFWKHIATN